MPQSGEPKAERPPVSFEGLLREARAGSREALGRLLDECRPYLLMVANQELDSDLRAKGGASDIVQDTFVEAHAGFGLFRGNEKEELNAWLRQALLNNLANFSREYRGTQRRRLSREIALDADGSKGPRAEHLPAKGLTPSGIMSHGEQAQKLQEALAQLPDEYRLVIQLRHQRGLSFEEVGKALDKTAEAARKLWVRAIEKMNEAMSEQESGE